jgi:hypothetical protein
MGWDRMGEYIAREKRFYIPELKVTNHKWIKNFGIIFNRELKGK